MITVLLCTLFMGSLVSLAGGLVYALRVIDEARLGLWRLSARAAGMAAVGFAGCGCGLYLLALLMAGSA